MASAKYIKNKRSEYISIRAEKGSLKVTPREADEILADLQIMYTREVYGKPRATSREERARELYLYGNSVTETKNE